MLTGHQQNSFKTFDFWECTGKVNKSIPSTIVLFDKACLMVRPVATNRLSILWLTANSVCSMLLRVEKW